MVAKDTVIGIVGAVILVAALTGVFYYEGSSAEGADGPATEYQVTWSTEPAEGPSTDGSTSEGETTTETLTVETSNVTTAEFVLTWTDDVGSPDTFNLTVTTPSGDTVLSQSGDSGEVAVSFEAINTMPPETTVTASSEEEARSQAAEQYTATRGQGDWTVEITCEEAGDNEPVPGGPPAEEDTGNSWELETNLDVYSATIQPS